MARYDLAAVAGKLTVAENTRLMSAFDLVGTSHYECAKSAAVSEANGTKIKRSVTRRRGLWTDHQIPIYGFGTGAAYGIPETYLRAANRLVEWGQLPSRKHPRLVCVRIPTQSGQVFRFEAGQHSGMKSDTVPINFRTLSSL